MVDVIRVRVTARAGAATLRRNVRRVLGLARMLLRPTDWAAHPLLPAAGPSPISACRGPAGKRLPDRGDSPHRV